ncbi:hypothetical protein RI054_26g109100 [Pseudoscourfieldia marina]
MSSSSSSSVSPPFFGADDQRSAIFSHQQQQRSKALTEATEEELAAASQTSSTTNAPFQKIVDAWSPDTVLYKTTPSAETSPASTPQSAHAKRKNNHAEDAYGIWARATDEERCAVLTEINVAHDGRELHDTVDFTLFEDVWASDEAEPQVMAMAAARTLIARGDLEECIHFVRRHPESTLKTQAHFAPGCQSSMPFRTVHGKHLPAPYLRPQVLLRHVLDKYAHAEKGLGLELVRAVIAANVSVVEQTFPVELVKHGEEFDQYFDAGTAFAHAVRCKASTQVLELLIRANPNPAHQMVQCRDFYGVNGRYRMPLNVRYFLTSGGDRMVARTTELAPWQIAIAFGFQPGVLRWLVRQWPESFSRACATERTDGRQLQSNDPWDTNMLRVSRCSNPFDCAKVHQWFSTTSSTYSQSPAEMNEVYELCLDYAPPTESENSANHDVIARRLDHVEAFLAQMPDVGAALDDTDTIKTRVESLEVLCRAMEDRRMETEAFRDESNSVNHDAIARRLDVVEAFIAELPDVDTALGDTDAIKTRVESLEMLYQGMEQRRVEEDVPTNELSAQVEQLQARLESAESRLLASVQQQRDALDKQLQARTEAAENVLKEQRQMIDRLDARAVTTESRLTAHEQRQIASGTDYDAIARRLDVVEAFIAEMPEVDVMGSTTLTLKEIKEMVHQLDTRMDHSQEKQREMGIDHESVARRLDAVEAFIKELPNTATLANALGSSDSISTRLESVEVLCRAMEDRRTEAEASKDKASDVNRDVIARRLDAVEAFIKELPNTMNTRLESVEVLCRAMEDRRTEAEASKDKASDVNHDVIARRLDAVEAFIKELPNTMNTRLESVEVLCRAMEDRRTEAEASKDKASDVNHDVIARRLDAVEAFIKELPNTATLANALGSSDSISTRLESVEVLCRAMEDRRTEAEASKDKPDVNVSALVALVEQQQARLESAESRLLESFQRQRDDLQHEMQARADASSEAAESAMKKQSESIDQLDARAETAESRAIASEQRRHVHEQQMQGRTEAAEKALKEQREAINEMQARWETAKSRMDGFKEQRHEIEQQMQGRAVAAEVVLDELRDNIDDLQQQMQEGASVTEKVLKEQGHTINQLKALAGAEQSHLVEYKEQRQAIEKQLQDRAEAAEKSLKEHVALIEQLETRADSSESSFSEVSARLADYKEQGHALEQKLQGRAIATEAEVEEQGQMIDQLKVRADTEQSHLAEYKEQRQAIEKHFQDRVEAAEKSLKEHVALIEQLETRANTEQSHLAEYKEQRQAIEKQLQDRAEAAEKSLKEHVALIEQLETRADSSESSFSEVSARLAEYKQNHHAFEQQLHGRGKATAMALEDQHQTIEQLQARVKSAEKALQEQLASSDQQRQVAEQRMQGRAIATENALKKLRDTVDELQARESRMLASFEQERQALEQEWQRRTEAAESSFKDQLKELANLIEERAASSESRLLASVDQQREAMEKKSQSRAVASAMMMTDQQKIIDDLNSRLESAESHLRTVDRLHQELQAHAFYANAQLLDLRSLADTAYSTAVSLKSTVEVGASTAYSLGFRGMLVRLGECFHANQKAIAQMTNPR